MVLILVIAATALGTFWYYFDKRGARIEHLERQVEDLERDNARLRRVATNVYSGHTRRHSA